MRAVSVIVFRTGRRVPIIIISISTGGRRGFPQTSPSEERNKKHRQSSASVMHRNQYFS